MSHGLQMVADTARDPEPDWNLPTIPDASTIAEAVKPKRPAPWYVAAWHRLQATVGAQELQVLAGLVLLGRGCYLLHPAAGYVAPGLVLLWWALPQRPRFVEPRPPDVRVVTPPEIRRPRSK